MTKMTEWWRGTSTHMWRTYFDLSRNPERTDLLVPSTRKIYDVCHRVFCERFTAADQDILRTYFSSRWGDDLYVVEDYALKHNLSTQAIWKVIRRANRILIEELGLIERKEE